MLQCILTVEMAAERVLYIFLVTTPHTGSWESSSPSWRERKVLTL